MSICSTVAAGSHMRGRDIIDYIHRGYFSTDGPLRMMKSGGGMGWLVQLYFCIGYSTPTPGPFNVRTLNIEVQAQHTRLVWSLYESQL